MLIHILNSFTREKTSEKQIIQENRFLKTHHQSARIMKSLNQGKKKQIQQQTSNTQKYIIAYICLFVLIIDTMVALNLEI